LEPFFVPVARSFATRIAACLLAVSVVSGCSAPGAIGPTLNVQPKLAGQPVSLDTLAYDPTPTGAVPLPSPSSQAVATTDPGDGQMIGGSPQRQQAGGSDGNVVLNLSNVPLQQAAKTVLGDMIGANYVIDPRVDGVVSVQTTKPVNKADALEMFQAALVPIGAVLVQSRAASTGSHQPIRPRRG
jgi:general secretion pathway protein D